MTGTPTFRVALLNPCYWPEVTRGAERVIHELAGGLLERGHEPRVITSHPGAPSRAVEGGLPVIRNWRPPDTKLVERGFDPYLTHAPFTYRTLIGGDDTIAHAHYPSDAIAAAHWARRRGRPVVFSYHGIPSRHILAARRLRLRTVMSALARSDRVIVSSRAAADGMRRWLGVAAEPIHPPVRLDLFTPGDGRAPEPTIVCAADPDDMRKRVGMLVTAFSRLRRARPDARLLLLRPARASLASELTETPGVELFDRVSEPAALAPIYRRAWVSALTAYNEAFGLALAEALACGTPVVGTRDGGITEIIDHDGIGRLFARDDEDDLVRALDGALDLATDRSTAAACRTRAEDFGIDRFVDATLRVYEDVAG